MHIVLSDLAVLGVVMSFEVIHDLAGLSYSTEVCTGHCLWVLPVSGLGGGREGEMCPTEYMIHI